MIFALALALAPNTHPVVELMEPDASYVSVQAIVKMPELSAKQRAVATVLAETLTAEISDYSRATMREYAVNAGESLKVSLMPDHLRVQIGVLPRDLKEGVGFIASILKGSRFPAEAVARAIEEYPFRKRSLWSIALQPWQPHFDRIRREDVIELYQRICRPENVWLAVGGALESGVADEVWRRRAEQWSTPKLAPLSSVVDAPKEVNAVAGQIGFIDLRAREVLARDAALPTKLLCLMALGSGKGSALFEQVRDTKGWSYRQEGLFWPTTSGFQPRFLIATGEDAPLTHLAEEVRAELVKAIDGWKDADLQRAIGMAKGIVERGVELSPLYFNPSSPLADSLHDRTFLAAYWLMKTGSVWDSAAMLRAMSLVSLNEMRDTAREMVAGASARTIEAIR